MALNKHEIVSRNWFRWLETDNGKRFQEKMAAGKTPASQSTQTVNQTQHQPHSESNLGKK